MKEKNEQNTAPDLDRIRHECFWEYHFSNQELLDLAQHGTEREKFFVFTKIVENSGDVLKHLAIFSPADQQNMVLRYRPPEFNRHFLEKRYKILRYFLAGEEVDIPELRWNP